MTSVINMDGHDQLLTDDLTDLSTLQHHHEQVLLPARSNFIFRSICFYRNPDAGHLESETGQCKFCWGRIGISVLLCFHAFSRLPNINIFETEYLIGKLRQCFQFVWNFGFFFLFVKFVKFGDFEIFRGKCRAKRKMLKRNVGIMMGFVQYAWMRLCFKTPL